MGDVFLAQDPHIDRQLAIKTVRLIGGGAEEIAERKRRLLREAKAAGRLLHPHVVALFDAGEVDGSLFLAFEYVAGKDLHHRIAKQPPLTLREVLRIIREVSEALGYAHQQEIVHRDIKPSNILLAEDGRAKVADFGIAKLRNQTTELTRTGSVVGSPQYMSPEQVRGEALDGRSDLFSVGVMFYELLSRTRPFEGETLSTLVFQILSKEPPSIDTLRPGLPSRRISLVHRMVAKDRDHRVASAQEVVDEIRELERTLEPERLDVAAAQSGDDHQATARLSTTSPPASPVTPPPSMPPPPPVPGAAGGGSHTPPVLPVSTPPPALAQPALSPAAAPMTPGPLPAAAAKGGKGKFLPLALVGCLGLGAVILGGGWWVASTVLPTLQEKAGLAGPASGDEGAEVARAEDPGEGPAVDEADSVAAEASPGPVVEPGSAPDPTADVFDEDVTEPENSEPEDVASSEPTASAPVEDPVESATRATSATPSASPPVAVREVAPPPTAPPPSVVVPPPARVVPSPPPPQQAPPPPVEPPPPAEPTAEEEWDAAAAGSDLERTISGFLRLDIQPDDAVLRTWQRGEERAVVQGSVRYFRPKKKGERSLELAPGDYLLTFVHDSIGEYTIRARVSGRGAEPDVLRLDLTTAPRR